MPNSKHLIKLILITRTTYVPDTLANVSRSDVLSEANPPCPAFPAPDGYSIAYDVAGSGGYGDPANRDPASIHEDIINGYVSPDQAQQEYGIDPSTMVCEYCGGKVVG